MGGCSGANGGFPAMMSAAFSAIMITGAFRFPLTMDGITLASTTFKIWLFFQNRKKKLIPNSEMLISQILQKNVALKIHQN